MKRNTKRAVKAATSDPVLTLSDSFPLDAEGGEEHHVHDLGEDHVFHRNEEAEDAPNSMKMRRPPRSRRRTRTRPTMRWACTCARWAPSRFSTAIRKWRWPSGWRCAASRYRHAALASWRTLDEVVQVFERVLADECALDPTIDVVKTLHLSRDEIIKRMPHNVKTLRRLIGAADADFRTLERASTAAARDRMRRDLYRRLRKAIVLAEEMSPRIDLLDRWVDEMAVRARQMADLQHEIDGCGRSAADRERCTKLIKQLRDLKLETRSNPEDLTRLVHVLEHRRKHYQKARRELAEGNLRLVVSIAKRYRSRGLPFSDLIQEGNRGLMRAVDKYEHRLGYKFGTYATWWIRQGITRALADHARTIRVPCHQVGTLAAVERVRGELSVASGREPTVEEIAAVLGVTAEETQSLRAVSRHPVSLHEPLGGDGERALEDFLDDPDATNPGQAVDQHLLRERIGEVLRSLTPREREVIELRFGLRDGQPRTLEEVARAYGITRERIRQIEARGLLKLRQPLRSQRLAEFAEVESAG